MKRFMVLATIIIFPFLLQAQMTVSKIEGYIPNLQYDSDFMIYLEMSMKDGFTTVKKVVGKMKFVRGEKIYAIENISYSSGKKVKEKVTYFYLKGQPIAISDERDGKVHVYFLDSGKVIASKTLKARDYKPFGGKKILRLSAIALDAQAQSPQKEYLTLSAALLNNLKQAAKGVLNYRF